MEYFQIKMDLLINDIQRLEGKTGEETINDDDSRFDIFYSRTMHTGEGEGGGNSRFFTWFCVFYDNTQWKIMIFIWGYNRVKYKN